MAREITQRQRAEDLYSSIKASCCGSDDDQATDDLCVEMMTQALTTARQEALREARVIIERAAVWTPQSVLAILDRLAREGVTK